jgi:hypothetical protein
MSKCEIVAGSTDQTIDVFIQDSSVTTGAGLTGLVYNTSNLVCYYRKGATGTPTALSLATQTVGGAHSDGGFVAVDGTNCPGQYRLDLSDTIIATAGRVTLYLKGATNMAPCLVEIEVVAVNKYDAVRGGMTSLSTDPFATWSALLATAANLATLTSYVDTEVAAIKAKTDNLPSDPADASDIAASFSSIASTLTTIAAYIDTEVAAIKAKTDNLPSDPADASDLASTLSVIAAYVDTEVAAIKAVTDKLNTGLELDGSVYRWTTNALEQAPSGGGGGIDWADLVADNDDTPGSFGKAIADILVDTSTSIPAAIEDIDAGPTYPSRINFPPSPAFTIQVPRRTDGTYKCPKPIRLTAGDVHNVYVFIDMSPLFGATDFVQEVGDAEVSAGSITQGDDNGPRDTYAVIELGGTADDDCEITVPVTMASGTTVDVVFVVEVLGD